MTSSCAAGNKTKIQLGVLSPNSAPTSDVSAAILSAFSILNESNATLAEHDLEGFLYYSLVSP